MRWGSEIMAAVNLSEFPKNFEYEEYISAYFHSAGYYVERNIVEKDIELVLELDIISTNYNKSPPEIKLFEVKSGDWGFPDIFKLRGWMDYLAIENGGLIANNERRNNSFLKERARSLNIETVIIPNSGVTIELFNELFHGIDFDPIDVETWRFSYWVERNLLKRLKINKNSDSGKKCYKILDDYLFEVNSGIFFTENVIEKVEKLYKSFQKFPYISAKCGNEMIGNDFDDDAKSVPGEIFGKTFYKCEYNDIQISTFVEHRSRLAILKNVVDYQIYKNAGLSEKIQAVPKVIIDFPNFHHEINSFDTLPQTFKDGLNAISTEKFFNRYPIFWQWFFWIFGGFILKEFEDREYELLSTKTGIPIEEIPNALNSYQKLFPIQGGWFQDLPNSEIRVMKMFPVPFMGIGANYRRFCYTEKHDFDELKLKGMFTFKDLIQWNNLAVEVLREFSQEE